MSMRNYACHSYGIIAKYDEINYKELMKDLNLEFDENDKPENLIPDLSEELLHNVGFIDGIQDKGSFMQDYFEGDISQVFYTEKGLEINLDSDNWLFFDLPKYPRLFTKAYEDENHLIAELKEKYGKYLPENFDYISHVVEMLYAILG